MCPTSSAFFIRPTRPRRRRRQGVKETSARRVDGVVGRATPSDDESLREDAQGIGGRRGRVPAARAHHEAQAHREEYTWAQNHRLTHGRGL